MEKLKPCPFCDSTYVHVIPTGLREPPRYYVMCHGCHTEGPVDLGESGAVEKWNTRPEVARLEEQAHSMPPMQMETRAA